MQESFDSLVAKLMNKGYSKEYATKIAGKVAKEKGMIGGHHEDEDQRVCKIRNMLKERYG